MRYKTISVTYRVSINTDQSRKDFDAHYDFYASASYNPTHEQLEELALYMLDSQAIAGGAPGVSYDDIRITVSDRIVSRTKPEANAALKRLYEPTFWGPNAHLIDFSKPVDFQQFHTAMTVVCRDTDGVYDEIAVRQEIKNLEKDKNRKHGIAAKYYSPEMIHAQEKALKRSQSILARTKDVKKQKDRQREIKHIQANLSALQSKRETLLSQIETNTQLRKMLAKNIPSASPAEMTKRALKKAALPAIPAYDPKPAKMSRFDAVEIEKLVAESADKSRDAAAEVKQADLERKRKQSEEQLKSSSKKKQGNDYKP